MWWNHKEVCVSKRWWVIEVCGIRWKEVIMKASVVSGPMTWEGRVITWREMISLRKEKNRVNHNSQTYDAVVMLTLYWLTLFSSNSWLNFWSWIKGQSQVIAKSLFEHHTCITRILLILPYPISILPPTHGLVCKVPFCKRFTYILLHPTGVNYIWFSMTTVHPFSASHKPVLLT